MNTNRRQFFNYIFGAGLLGWLGSLFYPLFSYLNPPKISEANISSIKAGLSSELRVNSAKILKFGRKPVILIKTESSDFRAFSATCTHLDCIVQYRKDTKQIWCACHNGVYDLRGRNISGPPPRPLEEFTVKIIQDEIIISKQT
jgi:Rieske Fe-S protein